jgi:hypothetical protein
MEKSFRRVVPDNISVDNLTPLDITCGATKCNEGFHCFSLKKSSLKKFGKTHVCYECGIELIDWDRIHKNDIKDAPYIFNSLKKELIRHVVWHTEIDPNALTKVLQKGRNKTKEHVIHVLNSRIGNYNQAFDGRQTPKGGTELVNYAQHATATCCRGCLEIWHNIPKNIKLTNQNITYCSELIMLFIDEKLPNLSDNGGEK